MTVESAADQALALKKRARRRLVGAIALVLLMLIILPNVLKDRAQEDQRSPITLTMPEEMPPVEIAPENAVAESADTPTPAPENIAPPAPIENSAPSPAPQPVSPPAEAPKAVEAPIVQPETPKAEVAKPNAVKSNKAKPSEVKPSDVKPTHYLIQVGVFSDADNVKKLQAKISEAGFSSRTVKLSTPKGEKIRLRVGSFVTRDAAAEALKKMEAHGLSGMVLMDE